MIGERSIGETIVLGVVAGLSDLLPLHVAYIFSPEDELAIAIHQGFNPIRAPGEKLTIQSETRWCVSV